MKHLDLKPVADRCKKMLYKGCLFVGTVAACGLAACSDDYEGTVSMNFPQMQTIVCNADETKDFSFDASAEWSLSSSEIWCKLVQDGQESFVISGTGGTQHISIHVTDENSTAEEASTAKLELTMGNRTVAIAEVIRSAKGSELKIYDMDGNELEYLTVGYDDFEPFKVKANYHFAVTGTPDWVEVEGGSMVGTSNQETQGGLQIIQDGTVEKYPIALEDGEKIVFTAENGKAFAEFPLVYAGMPATEIAVTRPSSNPYNWAVSNDGRTFMQENAQGSTSGSETYTNRIPFTVKALSDDYEFVYMDEWEDNAGNKNISPIEDPSMLWMHCEGENGDITLRVDENVPLGAGMPVEDRVGYVLVFQRAVYETIKDDLEGNIVENGDIKYEYQQRNLLIQFTQKELETSTGEQQDIIATGGNGEGAVEVSTYTGEKLSFYQSTYGVQAVAEINEPLPITMLTLPFEVGDFAVYDLETDASLPATGVDPAGTYVTVDADKVGRKDIYLVLTEWTETRAARKAMVILHLSNVKESEPGGDESTCPLSISDNMMQPINSISYEGDDVNYWMSTYGCESVWQVESPGQSIFVAMSELGASISTIECYDFSTESLISAPDDIVDMGDGSWNIWMGTSLSGKTVYLKITDNGGTSYGLILGVTP